MNRKLALAILATPLVVGCHHQENQSASLNEMSAAKSGEDRRIEMPPNEDSFAALDENPFGPDLDEDTRRPEKRPNDAPAWIRYENPKTEVSWEEPGGTGVLSTTIDFQPNNLVPCPDGFAEFVLEIKAMRGGSCFYQWRQSFCRYDERKPDPSDEHGMSHRELLVCAMLNNGFASGTYHYLELADETVTVRIDFEVSKAEDAQEFAAELTAACNESGKVDAGSGNTFEWSFKPPS